jgi:hypothetical protein
MAAAEATKANDNLVAARALLVDLTDEIAPLARAETTARAAVDAAKAAQVIRDAATKELGTVAATSPTVVAATGARAVEAAALVTKESVEAQQAFHDARSAWAADNLEPAARVYNAA